ncbi:MAG TPA: response regulator [Geobacteraceae bacterium]|nr:response regulator [Geobacteraceae bacterium]
METARNRNLGQSQGKEYEMRTRDILLVDDCAHQLQLLSILLESKGFDVTAASNGVKALDTLKQNRFRMMITDLNMPGMNGIQLAAHVKDLHRNTHIILVTTATLLLETREAAVTAGITKIFRKPVNLNALVESIRSSLPSHCTPSAAAFESSPFPVVTGS